MHDIWSNQVIVLQLIAITIFSWSPSQYSVDRPHNIPQQVQVMSSLFFSFFEPTTSPSYIQISPSWPFVQTPSICVSHPLQTHMKLCFMYFSVYILWHHTGRLNIRNWIPASIPPNFIFVKLLYFLKFWICILITQWWSITIMTLWDNRMVATCVCISEGTAHRQVLYQNNSVATGLTACINLETVLHIARVNIWNVIPTCFDFLTCRVGTYQYFVSHTGMALPFLLLHNSHLYSF